MCERVCECVNMCERERACECVNKCERERACECEHERVCVSTGTTEENLT